MINYTEYYTNKVNNDINIDNKISKQIAQNERKIKHPEPIKQVKNQALGPPTEKERVEKTQLLNENSRENKTNNILKWVSTTAPTCSSDFERSDIILNYLNKNLKDQSKKISRFNQVKGMLNSYEYSVLNTTYDYFHNVYTGGEYVLLFDDKKQIDITQFIKEQNQQLKTESFRHYFIVICQDQYIKNNKKNLTYLTEFNTKVLENSTVIDQEKLTNDVWSTTKSSISKDRPHPDFTLFSNEQLIIIYRKILMEENTMSINFFTPIKNFISDMVLGKSNEKVSDDTTPIADESPQPIADESPQPIEETIESNNNKLVRDYFIIELNQINQMNKE
jgi:hypothetical protein